MTVDDATDYLHEHWPSIRSQLLKGTYQPQPVKRVEIPKPDGGIRNALATTWQPTEKMPSPTPLLSGRGLGSGAVDRVPQAQENRPGAIEFVERRPLVDQGGDFCDDGLQDGWIAHGRYLEPKRVSEV